MANGIARSKILSSFLWSFLQRSGVQGIQLIITLLLARILLPEDFGLIVIVTALHTWAIILIESGFTTALIQKKRVDDVDFSSIFYVNMLSSTMMYGFLYYSAPNIAAFFEQPQLTSIIRVISLSLFLCAFNSIQHVIVSRTMQFKKLFFSTSLAHFLSGSIGIGMAYAGFGVWALVGQQLASYLFNTVFLYFRVKWRPQLVFSMTSVIDLFSSGWKWLLSSIIHTSYSNLHHIIIGKLFHPAMIGFYNRGELFPNILVSNLNGSIQSVMLPTLSSYQDDRQRVKEMVRRSIVTSCFFIFPMMVGLAIIAEPLVKLLLTDKWLPAVPFLQIFCMFYALEPIQSANSQAINALGRSDIFLKLQIIKTLLGLVILIFTFQFGIYAIAFGLFVSNIISSVIDAYPNLQLLNYSIMEQWRDIIPSLLLAFIMGAIIYMVHWLDMSLLSTIIVQMSLGIIIYIGLAKAFKLECFDYLLFTLRRMMRSGEQS